MTLEHNRRWITTEGLTKWRLLICSVVRQLMIGIRSQSSQSRRLRVRLVGGLEIIIDR